MKTVGSTTAASILFVSLAAPWAEAGLWHERRQALHAHEQRQSKPGPLLAAALHHPERTDSLDRRRVGESLLGAPIPESLGTIADAWSPPSRSSSPIPLVIHIQDAHGDAAAQWNAAQILQQISRAADAAGEAPPAPGAESPLLICVEGAWGPVRPEWLALFPDSELAPALHEALLRKGLITGEEFWALRQGLGRAEIQGVEDRALYEGNVRSRALAKAGRKAMLARLSQLEARLARLKKLSGPAGLRELDEAARRFAEHRLKLQDYLARIIQTVPSEWSASAYPHLAELQGLQKLEAQFSAADVMTERSRVIQWLGENLDEVQLRALADASLRFRLGRVSDSAYHNYLAAMARSAGRPAPSIETYARYLEQTAQLSIDDCLEELAELERKAVERLCMGDARLLSLHRADRLARLARLFWSERFTPADWKAFRAELRRGAAGADVSEPRLHTVLREIEGSLAQQELRAGLQPRPAPRTRSAARNTEPFKALDAAEFEFLQQSYYKLAFKRDRAMAEKTLELSNGRAAPRVVLIAGGFHTPGLTEVLRERSTPYVVIRPSLKAAALTSPSRPIRLARERSARLSRDFARELRGRKAQLKHDPRAQHLLSAAAAVLEDGSVPVGPLLRGGESYLLGSHQVDGRRTDYVLKNSSAVPAVGLAWNAAQPPAPSTRHMLRELTRQIEAAGVTSLAIEIEAQIFGHPERFDGDVESFLLRGAFSWDASASPELGSADAVRARLQKFLNDHGRGHLSVRVEDSGDGLFRISFERRRRDPKPAPLEDAPALTASEDGVISLLDRRTAKVAAQRLSAAPGKIWTGLRQRTEGRLALSPQVEPPSPGRERSLEIHDSLFTVRTRKGRGLEARRQELSQQQREFLRQSLSAAVHAAAAAPEARLGEVEVWDGLAALGRYMTGRMQLDAALLPSESDDAGARLGKSVAARLALMHQLRLREYAGHLLRSDAESNIFFDLEYRHFFVNLLASRRELDDVLNLDAAERDAYLQGFLARAGHVNGRSYIRLVQDVMDLRVRQESSGDPREIARLETRVTSRIARYLTETDRRAALPRYGFIDLRRGTERAIIRAASLLTRGPAGAPKEGFARFVWALRLAPGVPPAQEETSTLDVAAPPALQSSARPVARAAAASRAQTRAEPSDVRPRRGLLESLRSRVGTHDYADAKQTRRDYFRSGWRQEPVENYARTGINHVLSHSIGANERLRSEAQLYEVDEDATEENDLAIIVDSDMISDEKVFPEVIESLKTKPWLMAILPRAGIDMKPHGGLLRHLILAPLAAVAFFVPLIYGPVGFVAPFLLAVPASSVLLYQWQEYIVQIQMRKLISLFVKSGKASLHQRENMFTQSGNLTAPVPTWRRFLFGQRQRWYNGAAQTVASGMTPHRPDPVGWDPNRRHYVYRRKSADGYLGMIEDPAADPLARAHITQENPQSDTPWDENLPRIRSVRYTGEIGPDDRQVGGTAPGVPIIDTPREGLLLISPRGKKFLFELEPRQIVPALRGSFHLPEMNVSKAQKQNMAYAMLSGRVYFTLPDGSRVLFRDLDSLPQEKYAELQPREIYSPQLREAQEAAERQRHQEARAATREYHRLNASTIEVQGRTLRLPARIGFRWEPSAAKRAISALTFGYLDPYLYKRSNYWRGTWWRGQPTYTTLMAYFEPRELERVLNDPEAQREMADFYNGLVARLGADKVHHLIAELTDGQPDAGAILDDVNAHALILYAFHRAADSLATGNPLARYMFTGSPDGYNRGDLVRPFGILDTDSRSPVVDLAASTAFDDWGQDGTWYFGSMQAMKRGARRLGSYHLSSAPSQWQGPVRAFVETLVVNSKRTGYMLDDITVVSHSGRHQVILTSAMAGRRRIRDAGYERRVEDALNYLGNAAVPAGVSVDVLTPEEMAVLTGELSSQSFRASASTPQFLRSANEQYSFGHQVRIARQKGSRLARITPLEAYLEAQRSEPSLSFQDWLLNEAELEPTADQIRDSYRELSRRWVRSLNQRLREMGRRTLSLRAQRTGEVKPGSRDERLLIDLFGEPGQRIDSYDRSRWYTALFGIPIPGFYMWWSLIIPFSRPWRNPAKPVSALALRYRIAEGRASSLIGPSTLWVPGISPTEDLFMGAKIATDPGYPFIPASGVFKLGRVEEMTRRSQPGIQAALAQQVYEGMERARNSIASHPLDRDLLRPYAEMLRNQFAWSGISAMPDPTRYHWGAAEATFGQSTWQRMLRVTTGLYPHGNILAYWHGRANANIAGFEQSVALLRSLYGESNEVPVDPRLARSVATAYSQREIQEAAAQVRAESGAGDEFDLVPGVRLEHQKQAAALFKRLLYGDQRRQIVDLLRKAEPAEAQALLDLLSASSLSELSFMLPAARHYRLSASELTRVLQSFRADPRLLPVDLQLYVRTYRHFHPAPKKDKAGLHKNLADRLTHAGILASASALTLAALYVYFGTYFMVFSGGPEMFMRTAKLRDVLMMSWGAFIQVILFMQFGAFMGGFVGEHAGRIADWARAAMGPSSLAQRARHEIFFFGIAVREGLPAAWKARRLAAEYRQKTRKMRASPAARISKPRIASPLPAARRLLSRSVFAAKRALAYAALLVIIFGSVGVHAFHVGTSDPADAARVLRSWDRADHAMETLIANANRGRVLEIAPEDMERSWTFMSPADVPDFKDLYKGRPVTFRGKTYQGKPDDHNIVTEYLFDKYSRSGVIMFGFDGYSLNLPRAADELAAQGFQAQVFVAPEDVDDFGRDGAEILKILKKKFGWHVGASTLDGSSLEGSSAADFVESRNRSAAILERWGIAQYSSAFAFPDGVYDQDALRMMTARTPTVILTDRSVGLASIAPPNMSPFRQGIYYSKIVGPDTSVEEARAWIDEASRRNEVLMLRFRSSDAGSEKVRQIVRYAADQRDQGRIVSTLPESMNEIYRQVLKQRSVVSDGASRSAPGWTVTGDVERSVSRNNPDPYEYNFKMRGSDAHAQIASPSVDIQSGKSYQVGFRLKLDSYRSGNLVASAIERDAEGNVLGWTPLLVRMTDYGGELWTEHESMLFQPRAGAHSFQLIIHPSENSEFLAHVGDLSIISVTAAAQQTAPAANAAPAPPAASGSEVAPGESQVPVSAQAPEQPESPTVQPPAPPVRPPPPPNGGFVAVPYEESELAGLPRANAPLERAYNLPAPAFRVGAGFHPSEGKEVRIHIPLGRSVPVGDKFYVLDSQGRIAYQGAFSSVMDTSQDPSAVDPFFSPPDRSGNLLTLNELIYRMDVSVLDQEDAYTIAVVSRGQVYQSVPFSVSKTWLDGLPAGLARSIAQRRHTNFNTPQTVTIWGDVEPGQVIRSERKVIPAPKGYFHEGNFSSFARVHYTSFNHLSNWLLYMIGVSESKNMPYGLEEEYRYALEFAMAMQRENGGVYSRMGPTHQTALSARIEDHSDWYLAGGYSTSDAAGMVKLYSDGAVFFRESDPALSRRLAQAALKSWQFLREHPQTVDWEAPEGIDGGAFGWDPDDSEKRVSAAVAMLQAIDLRAGGMEASGLRAELRQYIDDHIGGLKIRQFHHLHADSLAVQAVLASPSTADMHDARVSARIILDAYLEELLWTWAKDPSGLATGRERYTWGSNLVIAEDGMKLLAFSLLTGDPDAVNAAASQLRYLLGYNPQGRSQFTGFGPGAQTPEKMHDVIQKYIQDYASYLIGGGNALLSDGRPGVAELWKDDRENWYGNEITLDSNTPPLVLADFLSRVRNGEIVGPYRINVVLPASAPPSRTAPQMVPNEMDPLFTPSRILERSPSRLRIAGVSLASLAAFSGAAHALAQTFSVPGFAFFALAAGVAAFSYAMDRRSARGSLGARLGWSTIWEEIVFRMGFLSLFSMNLLSAPLALAALINSLFFTALHSEAGQLKGDRVQHAVSSFFYSAAFLIAYRIMHSGAASALDPRALAVAGAAAWLAHQTHNLIIDRKELRRRWNESGAPVLARRTERLFTAPARALWSLARRAFASPRPAFAPPASRDGVRDISRLLGEPAPTASQGALLWSALGRFIDQASSEAAAASLGARKAAVIDWTHFGAAEEESAGANMQRATVAAMVAMIGQMRGAEERMWGRAAAGVVLVSGPRLSRSQALAKADAFGIPREWIVDTQGSAAEAAERLRRTNSTLVGLIASAETYQREFAGLLSRDAWLVLISGLGSQAAAEWKYSGRMAEWMWRMLQGSDLHGHPSIRYDRASGVLTLDAGEAAFPGTDDLLRSIEAVQTSA